MCTATAVTLSRLRGGGGNRTRVQGFAGPCLSHSATPPGGRDPTTAARATRRAPGSSAAEGGASSGRRDSNPRPSPWQGDALPAALRPRVGSDLHCRVPGDDSIRSATSALQTSRARSRHQRRQPLPQRDRPGGQVPSSVPSLRDDLVGDRAALLVGRLGGHPRSRVGSRSIPRSASRCEPSRSIGLDHHDDVEPARQSVLDEQRDVVDDDGAGRHGRHQLGRPRARRADARSRSGRRGPRRRRTRSRASAARSSSPSGPTTSRPNRATTAAKPGVPGSTTSRAIASASMITAPCSASSAATVLLPDPTPPVSPTLTRATVPSAGPADRDEARRRSPAGLVERSVRISDRRASPAARPAPRPRRACRWSPEPRTCRTWPRRPRRPPRRRPSGRRSSCLRCASKRSRAAA